MLVAWWNGSRRVTLSVRTMMRVRSGWAWALRVRTSLMATTPDLIAALAVVRHLLDQPPLVAAFLELLARAETHSDVADRRHALATRADTALRSLLGEAVAANRLADKDIDTAIATLLGPLFFRRLIHGENVDEAMTEDVVDRFLQ